MRKRIIRTSSGQNVSILKDRFFICFFAIFCSGLILGAVTAGMCKLEPESTVFNVWQQNFSSVSDGNLFSVFLHDFISCLIYFILIYSLGVCATGIPFLCAVPLVLGIGKGLMLGLMLSKDNLAEVFRNILFIIPQNVIFCVAVILAVSFAAKMSLQTFSLFVKIRDEQQYISFKKYNQRFIVFGSFLLFFCLVDSILMKFF